MNELRWLNYTTLAYGGLALSYYSYWSAGHYNDMTKAGLAPEQIGMLYRPDGTITAQPILSAKSPVSVQEGYQLQAVLGQTAHARRCGEWQAENELGSRFRTREIVTDIQIVDGAVRVIDHFVQAITHRQIAELVEGNQGLAIGKPAAIPDIGAIERQSGLLGGAP